MSWKDMEFNLNNSDDEEDDEDDEDEQRRQEDEQRRQEEEARRQAEEVAAQRKMFADVGVDPNAPIDGAELEPDIQRELQQQQEHLKSIHLY
jgi:hypothetical protein